MNVLTVGLVGCSGNKLAFKAPARDLYRSALFTLARRYCERHCDRWGILSAKYGLVLPDDEIEPYDDVLVDRKDSGYMWWVHETREKIIEAFPPPVTYVSLAGKLYAYAIPHPEVFPGVKVLEPMKGLGIGRRLHFLKWATE